MTQAIASAQALHRQGHEVVSVFVGANQTRSIPAFFREAFAVPVEPIASPGFVFKNGRSVAPLVTARRLFLDLGTFGASLARLRRAIERTRPDVIVNFLEPLVGLLNLVHPHPIPVVSVGHQFLIDHPDFVKVRGFGSQIWGMRQYVRLTGARSTRVALSFYPAAAIPERRIVVCPPLLRRELFGLRQDVKEPFLLVYLLNQAYADDIMRWHQAHPEVEIRCFCEKPAVEPVWQYDAKLSFHRLDGVKFLAMMERCQGVACTAGFESLNEAAWLGKPLLVVPVENHVEQHLNAVDAEKAGLAIAARHFDLTPLLHSTGPRNLPAYRAWVGRASEVFLRTIEEVEFQARASRPIRVGPAHPTFAGSTP